MTASKKPKEAFHGSRPGVLIKSAGPEIKSPLMAQNERNLARVFARAMSQAALLPSPQTASKCPAAILTTFLRIRALIAQLVVPIVTFLQPPTSSDSASLRPSGSLHTSGPFLLDGGIWGPEETVPSACWGVALRSPCEPSRWPPSGGILLWDGDLEGAVDAYAAADEVLSDRQAIGIGGFGARVGFFHGSVAVVFTKIWHLTRNGPKRSGL